MTTAGDDALAAGLRPDDGAAGTTVVAYRPPLRSRLAGAVFVLPSVVWLGIFFLLPLAIILVVSLASTDAKGHLDFGHLDLHNYATALRPEYLSAFGNSLRYSLITTVLSLLIGYPIAYWISRYGGRRKTLLLILVMLPFWTSYLIRTYAWMIILRDNGVLNSILQAIGLTSDPIPFLNTDFSVILGLTYGFLPFTILPLYVSIDRLDPNLVHAGRDLYANGRQAFLHVTLPLTMPGIIAAALLTFIPAIGDYVTPDLLGGAQTTTIAKVVQVIFTSGRDWPSGSALGFLLMIATLIGTLAALRWVRRETLGGDLMIRERNPWLTGFAVLIYAFLFAPIVVLVIFSFNQSRRNFVWQGFTLDWYPKLFANQDLLDAVGITLQVALIAVVVSTILGTLLGLGLARLRFRGSGATETLILLPMVTPEIIMGISLLIFFAQIFALNGSLGQIALAHITFCISYVAITVRARAANMDPRLEEAARDLGDGAVGAFWHVTVPIIAPAIAAGAMLAFALSFDDLIVTSFNAGVGSTTLPIYIYSSIKFGVTPQINAISALIVGVVVVALVVAWRLGAFRGESRQVLDEEDAPPPLPA